MYFGDDEYAVLVVSKYCSGCNDAKIIISKLITEGYLVKIESIRKHPDVRYVPTLIVGDKKYIGLLKEDEYRKLIPKRPDDKRNNYDLI
jgi:hypothetical protein